jgi:hypothetical protein
MADCDNEDDQFRVFNVINDAVIPDPDAPRLHVSHSQASRRPWIISQVVDGLGEAFLKLRWE